MSLVSRRRLWSFFEALYSQELDESRPKADTPAWITTPLLSHQRTALAAAHALEDAKLNGMTVEPLPGEGMGGRLYTSYGILGDRVGSGKSLTALSLVKMSPPPDIYTEYVMRGQMLGDGRDVGLLRTRSQTTSSFGTILLPVRTALFIVPHALMGQWEGYVNKDTTLKALFLKKRNDASDVTLLTRLETFDAVFISATMWTTFRTAHPVHTILWSRIFIDEADSISISTDYNDLHARFYWFISASWLNLVFSNGAYFNITLNYMPLPETPTHIIDRVKELHTGSSFLSIPGCRHHNIVRRMCSNVGNGLYVNAAMSQSTRLILHSSESYIKSSFSSPSVTHRNIICATPPNIRVLDSFISPQMLERLNAGDLHGALESIGMSAHSETEISEAFTKTLQTELENARRTYEYKKGIEYSTEAIKNKALEACEIKIASIQSRIATIQDRIKRAKEQTCPICYCDVSSPSVTPCCQQLFCFPCLCESLKRVAACPLCRARIEDLKAVKVLGEKNTVVPTVTAPEKLKKPDAFLEFVRTHPDAKILMFSGYDATFSQLEDRLTEEKFNYATVNGSQARIAKLLREFNAGKYNILFLNARNMGAGLNIEAATHVVLYHKMSAELEHQIIGRAMRIGRSASLEVLHLLHENELDTSITHV
jgi:hypothetical protein